MQANLVTNRIAEALRSGEKMAFFVGAGISVPAPSNVSDFQKLNLDTIKAIGGKSLSQDDYKELSQIRPEIMLQTGIDELGEEILQALEMLQGHQPNFNHFLLAEAIRQGNWVFTTNFENLIEDAYKSLTHQELNNLCYLDDHFQDFLDRLSAGYKASSEGYLFKLHGTIEDRKIGLDKFASVRVALNQVGQGLSDPKNQLLQYFLENHDFCFIGYSCQDDFTIYPALVNTNRTNTMFWLQHTPETNNYLKQRTEIEDENKSLAKKKESGQFSSTDRENINVNQVLLKTPLFYKVLGNASDFLRKELHPLLTMHSLTVSRPPIRNTFQQWAKTIDSFCSNVFFGRLFEHLGFWDTAEKQYAEGMAISKQHSDNDAFIKSKNILADLYAKQTQVDKELQAIQMYNECIEFIGKHMSASALTTATALRFDIANVERRLGQYPTDLKKWTDDMAQGLDVLRLKNLRQYAGCLNIIGLAHLRGDENELAVGIGYSEKSKRIRHKLGDKEGEASAANAISLLLLAQGRKLAKTEPLLAKKKFNSALNNLRIAFDIGIRYGFFRGCAQNCRNMGDACKELMKIAESDRSRHYYLKKSEYHYRNAIRYLDLVKPTPPPGELVNWSQGIAGLHRDFCRISSNPERQRNALSKIVSVYNDELRVFHDSTILREITHKPKELINATTILEESKDICITNGLDTITQQIDKLLELFNTKV